MFQNSFGKVGSISAVIRAIRALRKIHEIRHAENIARKNSMFGEKRLRRIKELNSYNFPVFKLNGVKATFTTVVHATIILFA